MTRDEVLDRLSSARAEFDRRITAIPPGAFEMPAPSSAHSPKEIVAHVIAYEELIVERLRQAHEGRTTDFDRDNAGWEAFNERIWAEVANIPAADVLERSEVVFGELMDEVSQLNDAELNERVGITEYIDPRWLQERTLAELIAIDGYDHYPMHFAALDVAAGRS